MEMKREKKEGVRLKSLHTVHPDIDNLVPENPSLLPRLPDPL